MPIRSLPAFSLRTGRRLPAPRGLLLLVNYLICKGLSLIGPAISGLGSGFLPALREVRARLMPSHLAAVPPRMAMEQSRRSGRRSARGSLPPGTSRKSRPSASRGKKNPWNNVYVKPRGVPHPTE